MKGLETKYVISGPMSGLKINFTGKGQHRKIHSDGHRDTMTDPARRGSQIRNQIV